jgi:ABC-type transporter Mla maintaining outer membrane lipid asymmetry ATPase subunit MlaF
MNANLLPLYVAAVVLVATAGLYYLLVTTNLIRAIIGLELITKGITVGLALVGKLTGHQGLAQTLIHDPAVYIFDEPMSGLDPIGRKMVSDLILELKSREKTIFFSSHILSDIERCCDKAAIIVEGRLRLIYDLRERGSKNDTLESIFLREAGKTASDNAL